MITLAADCLVFKLANGESVPWSADMVSADVMGEAAKWFDPDFLADAAKAVFHYFKQEQGRQAVSVKEFAEALERVLQGFLAATKMPAEPGPDVVESDLTHLARESGQGWELYFFARLRREVRDHVQKSPRLLRFNGLRDCVKHLLGAQRWGGRCRTLEEQILAYLRECLSAEVKSHRCSLLVQ